MVCAYQLALLLEIGLNGHPVQDSVVVELEQESGITVTVFGQTAHSHKPNHATSSATTVDRLYQTFVLAQLGELEDVANVSIVSTY